MFNTLKTIKRLFQKNTTIREEKIQKYLKFLEKQMKTEHNIFYKLKVYNYIFNNNGIRKFESSQKIRLTKDEYNKIHARINSWVVLKLDDHLRLLNKKYVNPFEGNTYFNPEKRLHSSWCYIQHLNNITKILKQIGGFEFQIREFEFQKSIVEKDFNADIILVLENNKRRIIAAQNEHSISEKMLNYYLKIQSRKYLKNSEMELISLARVRNLINDFNSKADNFGVYDLILAMKRFENLIKAGVGHLYKVIMANIKECKEKTLIQNMVKEEGLNVLYNFAI